MKKQMTNEKIELLKFLNSEANELKARIQTYEKARSKLKNSLVSKDPEIWILENRLEKIEYFINALLSNKI